MTQLVLSSESVGKLNISGRRTSCRCHFKFLRTVGIIIRWQWKMLKDNTYQILLCQTVIGPVYCLMSLILFWMLLRVPVLIWLFCTDILHLYILYLYCTVLIDPEACERFLNFFVDKVTNTLAHILPPAFVPSVSAPCSAIFDQFEHVTLSCLHEIVGHLKPSGSCPSSVL